MPSVTHVGVNDRQHRLLTERLMNDSIAQRISIFAIIMHKSY